MAIRPFLAMTAAEIRNTAILPSRTAWMACHFSPYGRGLSNIPSVLEEGSLLILDDITPIRGHDPEVITQQLMQAMEHLRFSGILLDFQRTGNRETADLAAYLSNALPCPAAVSQCYAESADCPVFLSPAAPSVPLKAHLSPWQNREIWLDVSPWGEVLELTEEGCRNTPLPPWEAPAEGFSDETLHCHYQITETETSARFTLWRTEKDLLQFLEEAAALGVTQAVGLYQELQVLDI